jgi:hypothetical protein
MNKSGHGNNPTEPGHSQTGEGVGRGKSGHGKNLGERGALTCWRAHWEGQVRTRKGSEQARGTHSLESASGGINQDTEGI